MKYIIIILFFLISSIPVYAQFEVCNSKTNKILHDVVFINKLTGIAVGDSGTIIRSQDGGLNWDLILQVDSIQFKKVKFWNDQNGIAIGTYLYLTNDGGLNWREREMPIKNFYDIDLISENEAIMSGSQGKIYKITEFGENIHSIKITPTDVELNHISFINQSIGFAHFQDASLARLFKTVDGGINWIEIEAISEELFAIVEDLKFLTEEIGFRGGWYNPHLQKTIDGANNWNQTKNENSEWDFWSSIYDFHIENNQPYTFFACGWYGEIFRSIDYGANWELLESPVSNTTTLRSIFFIDDFNGWIVGDNGTILKTTNGGGITSSKDPMIQCINLSPNPVKDKLIIEGLNISEIESIIIYSLSGQQILKFNTVNEISLKMLSEGTYIVEIMTPENKFIRKLIKQ